MKLKVVGMTKPPQSELFEGIPGVETAEDIACVMARNDYLEDWAGDMTFDEIMAPLDGETIEEKKRSLIEKLLKPPGHFGVFEHISLNVLVGGVSVITERQITRHRIATFDVQSMRYVDFDDAEFVEIPELDDPGLCGRNAEFDEYVEDMDDEAILYGRRSEFENAIEQSLQSYGNLLELGVAPENARAVLPLGTTVNVGVTLNARSLMHVVNMRGAGDAQWEAQELAQSLLNEASGAFPVTVAYYRKLYKEDPQAWKYRLSP